MNCTSSSFRDPSGVVYRDQQGDLYRQINPVYEEHYRRLIDGGLYRDLVENGLLIEHEEVSLQKRLTKQAFAVIRPQEVEFISYPYEWSFSALKHAALLTLEIQRRALGFGMWLKDASAYNVQFRAGRPIFIDTLSFERYSDGEPWVAYSQFCRHFLAPLALMAKTDVELGKLLVMNVDGIPLSLASKLLPWHCWFRFGLLVHVHMHARMIDRHASTSEGATASAKPVRLSRGKLLSLIDNLKRTIRKLKWSAPATEWADYYRDNSYGAESAERKELLVSQYLRRCNPKTVWDLGANTGRYSRLAAAMGATTIALDIDPACVEAGYLACRENKENPVLVLRQDLTNPSPAIGWAHRERMSLADRSPADVVMALALIHHLAIGNNLPLAMIARYFAQLGRQVIIEFVPKNDRQVQRLLRSREDIFPDYTRAGFEAAFGECFDIVDSDDVGNDGRVLYLMKRRV